MGDVLDDVGTVFKGIGKSIVAGGPMGPMGPLLDELGVQVGVGPGLGNPFGALGGGGFGMGGGGMRGPYGGLQGGQSPWHQALQQLYGGGGVGAPMVGTTSPTGPSMPPMERDDGVNKETLSALVRLIAGSL